MTPINQIAFTVGIAFFWGLVSSTMMISSRLQEKR